MSFCEKCGAELESGSKFCQYCGSEVAPVVNDTTNNFENIVNDFNNTTDTTSEYAPKDIRDNNVMAMLAYLGVLVLIPVFVAKDSKFARFHANQGLVLWLTSVILSLALGILSLIPVVGCTAIPVLLAVPVGTLVLMIMGIINAAQGKAKELPIIGKYRIYK